MADENTETTELGSYSITVKSNADEFKALLNEHETVLEKINNFELKIISNYAQSDEPDFQTNQEK